MAFSTEVLRMLKGINQVKVKETSLRRPGLNRVMNIITGLRAILVKISERNILCRRFTFRNLQNDFLLYFFL
jgi:hypothetical protein